MKKNFVAFILAIFLLCSTNLVFAASFGNFNATDMKGEIVSQNIFSKADLTMINIWGTFCGPCIQEVPILAQISTEYKDKGVKIVGIVIDAVNGSGTPQPDQIAFAKKLLTNANADYLNIVPSNDMLNKQLQTIMAVPTTIFVNKQGEIVGTTVIGSKTKENWLKIIDSLL
ncbi:MAG: TlpA disulfide reductase family protein [Acidaminococcaceae bacterium]|nr:TlpA disulfide reductase family protein [Acidaminococcaceae bacterium]MDD4722204.1 TlpA disulfide reductase family protein [Acidaminococcaceae bacterium]